MEKLISCKTSSEIETLLLKLSFKEHEVLHNTFCEFNTDEIVESSETGSAANVELMSSVNSITLNGTKFESSARLFEMIDHQPIIKVSNLCELFEMNLEVFSTEQLFRNVEEDETIHFRLQKFSSDHSKSNDVHTTQTPWSRKSGIFSTNRMKCEEFEAYQVHFTQVQEFENIRFGSNFDIANGFERQDNEMHKLPSWLQPNGSDDMLSRIPYSINGMNRMQMFLKVTGCFTPVHTENNWFISININIGPDDCVWYAVDSKYCSEMEILCREKNIPNLCLLEKSSHWPSLEDLEHAKIPVMKLIQKKGETILVSYGTFHWVVADGICNNVAYNIGPMKLIQFKNSWDRYHYNILHEFKSLVPMIFLTWQLARTSTNDFPNDLLVKIREMITMSYARYLLMPVNLAVLQVSDKKVIYVSWDEFSKLRCFKCHRELEHCGICDKEMEPRCIKCARVMKINTAHFIIQVQNHLEATTFILDSFIKKHFPAEFIIDVRRKIWMQESSSNVIEPDIVMTEAIQPQSHLPVEEPALNVIVPDMEMVDEIQTEEVRPKVVGIMKKQSVVKIVSSKSIHKDWKCDNCLKDFHCSKKTFNYHELLCTGQVKQCSFCQKSFKRNNRYYDHMKLHQQQDVMCVIKPGRKSKKVA